ncbi:MAG: glycoside hydrolase family 172 protein [Planctomycetota bacterium]
MHTSDLSTIHRLSDAESRSISPENPDGRRAGGGRHVDPSHEPSSELGRGWKVRPCVEIGPGQSLDLADIAGPGVIQSVWMTMRGKPRLAILRANWDGQPHPSVECPLADFFASAYGTPQRFVPVVSRAVCVNPGSAYNAYWPMPFREHARLTLTNLDDAPLTLYFQINYTLTGVPDDAAYFHATFRRVNPLPKGEVVTLLDGVEGRGQYVGTYLAWALNHDRWWGEGEVKFYLDDDVDPAHSDGRAVAGSTGFPTICGTGTEDYFGGSYNFEDKAERRYRTYCTPYAGLPDVVRPDGLYRSQMRFGMYRWHLPDPVRFRERIKVTVQALGWKPGGRRYLQRRDDIASVAYWYQTLPSLPLGTLPSRDELELT